MTKTLTQWMKENGYDYKRLADEIGYSPISTQRFLQSGKKITAKFAIAVEKLSKAEVKATELLERGEQLQKIAAQRLALYRARVEI